MQKYSKSVVAEIEWVQKLYEYNLSKGNKTLYNKETAEVLLRII